MLRSPTFSSGHCCATSEARRRRSGSRRPEQCEVAILGQRTRTFHVEGHHYALVTRHRSRAWHDDSVRGRARRRSRLATGRRRAASSLYSNPSRRTRGAPRLRLLSDRSAREASVYVLLRGARSRRRRRRALGVRESSAGGPPGVAGCPRSPGRSGVRGRSTAGDGRLHQVTT